MSQLRELGIRLLAAPTLQKAMQEVLDAPVAMLRAEMGMIHLYNPQSEELEIVAHGFCFSALGTIRAEEGPAYSSREAS